MILNKVEMCIKHSIMVSIKGSKMSHDYQSILIKTRVE